MKVTVIDEHLAQLTQLDSINCYLVREEDGFTLIDTCYHGAQHFILRYAAKASAQVRRIVLTHSHIDHVGSLDALREKLPAAELLISIRERRLYEGDFSLQAGEPQRKIGRSWFQRCKAKIDRAMMEDDHIGSLRVISTPGHTPGQIALFDSRNRALVVGDAFSSIFGLHVAGHLNLLFPFPTLATWDAKTAFASAEKLSRLEPSYLAPGHGKVLQNPVVMMKAALKRAAGCMM
ncbi:MAG TPA: MBL fold metallo-hydrolase [Chthoniobacterales bacterium]|jgi:glyoxylase-like metal-dependent hydrolase (beta-lactamase superfamily II)|nr:MBL fold metallo-hydrolase [Chthoniobacterales bacterium]